MSKRVLNDDETILLSRGLNFSVAPRKIPTEEIIASTESLARRLDKSEPGRGTLLRRRVQRCLEKANQPTPNLQSRERRALTTLRKDRSIVILPADKGRATVILDATDYKDKMNQLLSDGSYQKLKRDPTRRIERRIQDELKHVEVLGEIPQQQRQKLSPSFTQPPKLYGLPKIHKVNVPCRPIVSSIDSPTYALAKEMARILSPLAGSSSSYIKNSEHFAEMIESTTLSSCDLLVSFDIKNLFTNVPIPETMSRVAALLHADNGLEDRTTMSATTICKPTELCLRTTYFEFHEEFYEQVNGAAMGSPLSPVIANIYMEGFEEEAINTADDKPSLWVRYVDDTFTIWPHGPEKLKRFHNHLNSQNDSIQFTIEKEDNNSLPFLDVLVTKEGSRMTTSIYRKPTHTDQYLHYQSYHHPRIKSGIIKCLKARAEKVCRGSDITREKEHLLDVFVSNGYPEEMTRKALVSREQKRGSQTEEDKRMDKLYIPYIRGLSENVEKALKDLEVGTVFKTNLTLRRYLTKVKTPSDPVTTKGVVYRIPCECGRVYVGETGRTLKQRITEHKRAVKNVDSNNGMAVHVAKTKHQIRWDEAEVICREEQWTKRKVKEGLAIRRHDDNLNLDTGTSIDTNWSLPS